LAAYQDRVYRRAYSFLPVTKEAVGPAVDPVLVRSEQKREALRPALLAQADDLVVGAHGLPPSGRSSLGSTRGSGRSFRGKAIFPAGRKKDERSSARHCL